MQAMSMCVYNKAKHKRKILKEKDDLIKLQWVSQSEME